MASSEDERYSRFREERRVVFQDRTNLPGQDPVGTRPWRSSHSHRRAGSSPRCSPHRYRRSHSAQQPASRRHRSPQLERRSRWDQRSRSRSGVGQPHRDGPRDVSRNPSGSRRVSPVDSEGAAARRGPGERQRQHTSASPREVGPTAAAEDENQVEVLRLSHRELTQMIRESTSTASATAVLPGGYQNLKVQIPGSREARPIPVVVSIPGPSFPRSREPTATVSAPPCPACESAATVSAPQPLAREPAATVSVPPQASQEPEAIPEKHRPIALVLQCSFLPPRRRCYSLSNSGMSAAGTGQVTRGECWGYYHSAPELCCGHPQLEQPVLYHAASVRFAKGGPSH